MAEREEPEFEPDELDDDIEQELEYDPDEPVEDRADRLEEAAYLAHGYVDEEGLPSDQPVEDKAMAFVLTARCDARRDRERISHTRGQVVRHVWHMVPGPGQYLEQADPEAQEVLYNRLDKALFAMLDQNAHGPIQSRLNGEHGVVLCRTKATSEKGVWGFYVTRDWGCIAADMNAPDSKSIERAAKKKGRNAEMIADRIPEFTRKLKGDFDSTLRKAKSLGGAGIVARLEAQTGEAGDDE